jgi:hypothetical protein
MREYGIGRVKGAAVLITAAQKNLIVQNGRAVMGMPHVSLHTV